MGLGPIPFTIVSSVRPALKFLAEVRRFCHDRSRQHRRCSSIIITSSQIENSRVCSGFRRRKNKIRDEPHCRVTRSITIAQSVRPPQPTPSPPKLQPACSAHCAPDMPDKIINPALTRANNEAHQAQRFSGKRRSSRLRNDPGFSASLNSPNPPGNRSPICPAGRVAVRAKCLRPECSERCCNHHRQQDYGHNAVSKTHSRQFERAAKLNV